MSTTTENPELLSKSEAAEFLGVDERTIDRYRLKTHDPLPYIAFSKRNIRILRADLHKWIQGRRIG